MSVDLFSETLDLSTMTFADWLKIGSCLDKNPGWAYYQWEQHTKVSLSDLKIEDWEAIETQCDFKSGWAYHRYRDNRS